MGSQSNDDNASNNSMKDKEYEKDFFYKVPGLLTLSDQLEKKVIMESTSDLFIGNLASFDAFSRVCLKDSNIHYFYEGRYSESDSNGLFLIQGGSIKTIGEVDIEKFIEYQGNYTNCSESLTPNDLRIEELEKEKVKRDKRIELLHKFNLLSKC
mmetsp:Transcript_4073/g.6025  ORF Transcript_4073/g.6025 Transcript_4073/m.6025 type:complete len:154 (+) Transcript_4073:26-487(+)